jgi:catechol 2,3-dioxygenase-like lactoylglutathione lyase family enzyme
VRIDHVIYGTRDLGAAAAWLADEIGLAAVQGGRHDGLGTHNQLVPLGDGSFIELLAVADREEAMRSPLGSALCAAIERGGGPLGWAVSVEDVGGIARRLGTSISVVGRQMMMARLTGVAEALLEPCLPFFIERDAAWRRRSRMVGAAGLSWIEVSADSRRLDWWLGGARLPLRVVDGPPAIRAIGIGDRELRAR